MNNKRFTKDLRPGDRFTFDNVAPTVYTVESVRTDDRWSVVIYTIPTSMGLARGQYLAAPLSTNTIIGD